MKYATIFIFLLTLPSCQRNMTDDPKMSAANFQQFLKTIPERKLPLEFTCGLPDKTEFTIKYQEFNRFIPGTADRVYGSIKSTIENIKLVMFGESGDDIYPILYSFDNNGNVRDSLRLILNPCGGADETMIPRSSVCISNDLTITLTDTTKIIHLPKNNHMDDYVVDSIRITKLTILLNKNGRFIRNEKTYTSIDKRQKKK